MLRRLMMFAVAVLVVFAILVWLGVLQNPLASSSPVKQAAADQLSFRLGRNSFGDRVLLTANVQIAFVPQTDAPDQIVVTAKQGPYFGDFAWTIIQTPRGEQRLIGEVRTGGRSYRVCEYLNRADSSAGAKRAERMFQVNNEGSHFHNPEPLDPALLGKLFDGISAEQNSLTKEDGMAGIKRDVSGTLSSLASQAVTLCLTGAVAAAR